MRKLPYFYSIRIRAASPIVAAGLAHAETLGLTNGLAGVGVLGDGIVPSPATLLRKPDVWKAGQKCVLGSAYM